VSFGSLCASPSRFLGDESSPAIRCAEYRGGGPPGSGTFRRVNRQAGVALSRASRNCNGSLACQRGAEVQSMNDCITKAMRSLRERAHPRRSARPVGKGVVHREVRNEARGNSSGEMPAAERSVALAKRNE